MDRAAGARDEGARGGACKPFPDWQGQSVVIAASGPSQRKADLAKVRGEARLVVINETWRLAPWADLLYACDLRWWRSRAPSARAFKGLRVQGSVTEKEGLFPGCRPGYVDGKQYRMLFEGPYIGSGGHSGFQAINLAIRLGAERIILTGFDLAAGGRAHWHDDHDAATMGNPDDAFLGRLARGLDNQADAIWSRGIEIINASRETRLTRFPRMPIDEALVYDGHL